MVGHQLGAGRGREVGERVRIRIGEKVRMGERVRL